MIERIRQYADSDVNRFHMPGHAGENIDDALYDAAKYDITELDWSDNLQAPSGIIKDTEDNIASIYHAKRAFMLTQGATAGIDTSLLVAREARGELYLLGETHKSCISFASIIGLSLHMLKDIDEAIAVAEEGEWVYVTSPNYYGMTIDITRLLAARAKGSAVIVDEAHGAHFVYSSLLPESMASKADFVIESLHKTLPVFTGGAVLCVNNEKYIAMTEYFKNKIHSTSPSYLIMQSIDYATKLLYRDGERLYSEVASKIDAFKSGLDTHYKVEKTDDFTRLVISVDNSEDIAHYLQNNGTYIELFDDKRLVFIVTPWNADRLIRVKDTLNSYYTNGDIEEEETRKIDTIDEVLPVLPRAKSIHGELRFVTLEDAEGKVSMNEIAVYPPGVPVVRTGDIISAEAIRYIINNKDRIVGLIDGTIAVRELCEED